MSDKKDEYAFYAIMAWEGLAVVRSEKDNPQKVVLRFACKEAKPIVVSQFIKTFIYFNPAIGTWDIHEVATGIRIAGGATPNEAMKNAAAFIKEYAAAGPEGEKAFVKQMEIIGPHRNKTETTFDQAMTYLKAGEERNKRAHAARRIRNAR
jgi:hypothetical protein